MKIISGTDFTEHAAIGSAVAAALAGKLREKLLLIHALPFELIAMANEEQADLIVTGTHQRHGLERIFQMSVSRALLRHAPVSVLVVPGNREGLETPPASPRRVLAATDFSDAGNDAVRHAYSLLGAGGIVHLLHVTHPQALPGGEFEHGVGTRESATRHAEHLQSCAARLRALVPADASTRGIITEVEVAEHRTPAAAIAQAAERVGADVVCLGTHGVPRVLTALSGSVAQKVMNRSHRPLLVVHAAQT
jgi:nucleotide-binding universal stress UspA family protein